MIFYYNCNFHRCNCSSLCRSEIYSTIMETQTTLKRIFLLISIPSNIHVEREEIWILAMVVMLVLQQVIQSLRMAVWTDLLRRRRCPFCQVHTKNIGRSIYLLLHLSLKKKKRHRHLSTFPAKVVIVNWKVSFGKIYRPLAKRLLLKATGKELKK